MRSRWYDPTTAQFLNRDPVESVIRQPYSYADNNPINNTDPTGLASKSSSSCPAGGPGADHPGSPPSGGEIAACYSTLDFTDFGDIEIQVAACAFLCFDAIIGTRGIRNARTGVGLALMASI